MPTVGLVVDIEEDKDWDILNQGLARGDHPSRILNDLAANRSKWKAHERIVTSEVAAAHPGSNIGEQVTLDVTNLRTRQTVTIIADNTILLSDGNYKIVDAKYSSRRDLSDTSVSVRQTATSNQRTAYDWIARGEPVTVVPRGGKAREAGMTPGQPITLRPEIDIVVNRPGGGTVTRPWIPKKP